MSATTNIAKSEATVGDGAPSSRVGNVTHVVHAGRDIHLVGTAHVSKKSVDEVVRTIDLVEPDVICVELDELRLRTLLDPSHLRRLDVFQVIREQKVLYVLSSLALSSYQRRLAERLGATPGGEMKAAVELAEQRGVRLVLADRDIQATLKRTWANLSLWDRSKVFAALLGAAFASEEIGEADIEALKDRDTLSEAMSEFARLMPAVQRPLIDERDRYLSASIRDAPGQRIVAVVGAGHVDGIVRYLDTPVDLEALRRIPPPGPVTRLLGWLIPAFVVLALFWGYDARKGEGLLEMVVAWLVPTAAGGALFSVFAGAKPLTVLVAAVASPITTLSPALGVGMFTGLSEAWLRRPTVEDCERVQEDVATVRGLYRNRFLRVLLVAALSSVGAALGAFVGASWLVSLL